MSVEGQQQVRRRRPNLRAVEVQRVERITPRLVCVTVAGATLDGFTAPGPAQHIKVFFPSDGQQHTTLPIAGPEGPEFPPDQPRPISRTYTPRRWRPEERELDIEFVLHGDGLGSRWAGRARQGDILVLAGPGGRYEIDADADWYLLAGDHAALPAMGTILEALPASTQVRAFIDVEEDADVCALPTSASVELTWLHGAMGDAPPATRLEEAIRAADLPRDGRIGAWVACEASMMRSIRRYLLDELRLAPANVHTQGYWKQGAANHPDHDFGDDS